MENKPQMDYQRSNNLSLIPNASDDMKNYMEYKVAEKIGQIAPVILFVCGTLGNCWILIIMRKWNLGKRSNNMQVYMIFLAISDLLVLYSGLLRHWILWTFGLDIRSLTVVVCKGHTFLVYVSLYVSAWLLVIMTLERTCSACMPTRVTSLCTRRRAYFTIVFIVVMQCFLHLHFLVLLTLKQKKQNTKRTENRSLYESSLIGNGQSKESGVEGTTEMTTFPGPYSSGDYECDASTEAYSYYIHHIWPMLDFILISVIPSILVFLGNIVIVWKAKVSLWTAEELSVASNNLARRRRFSSMTTMLCLISVLFILSSLPACVYNLWERSNQAKRMFLTAGGSAKIELFWTFVNIAMYCNNTFNFYLYLFSGRKFRKAVTRQISRRRTESQSNVISGYSFHLQSRHNQPQELRNGHSVLNSDSINKRFQPTQQTWKQSSVKYKPCNMSNQSNAYL